MAYGPLQVRDSLTLASGILIGMLWAKDYLVIAIVLFVAASAAQGITSLYFAPIARDQSQGGEG